MRIGLVGVGRMGFALATRLKDSFELYIFDQNSSLLASITEQLGVKAVNGLEDLAIQTDVLILAVPDREVISCLKTLNEFVQPVKVINIATNVGQHVLRHTAAVNVKCINVKIVGQADEMMLGQEPIIVINDKPAELTLLAKEIFHKIGSAKIGNADIVSAINTTAAEKVLVAAVCIEENLKMQNINDPEIIRCAIRQVAVGILKAYADGNLGPFAREVVQSVKSKLKKQLV